MMLIGLFAGVGLPMAIGWSLVRWVEGRSPVLQTWERIALGFLLGLTLTMFLMFVAQTSFGLPLNVVPMLGLQIAALCVVGFGARRHLGHVHHPPVAHGAPWPRRWMLGLKILLGFGTAKILFSGVTFLFLVPPYLDDVIENWNLRAKVFLHDRALTLLLPGQDPTIAGGGVNSYPPTVPLAKAWLNILGGGAWNEALANSLHLLWFVAAALLLFAALRRMAGLPWALLGTYVLTALPLVVMHATNPYADVFMAAHVLATGSLTASALLPHLSGAQRATFLRLAILAIACLPFTKNEGLVLYFPPALLAWGVTLAMLIRRSEEPVEKASRILAFAIAACLAVALPWLAFKWTHALAFGNAKGILGLDIAWEPMAFLAIIINTFSEGNWLLLPGFLLLLIVLRGLNLLRSPLLPLTILAALPYAAQIGIFTLTGLSAEAMQQTGYARGLIHLVPVAVLIAVMLLKDFMGTRAERDKA